MLCSHPIAAQTVGWSSSTWHPFAEPTSGGITFWGTSAFVFYGLRNDNHHIIEMSPVSTNLCVVSCTYRSCIIPVMRPFVVSTRSVLPPVLTSLSVQLLLYGIFLGRILGLTDLQQVQISEFERLLLEWNRRLNLVSRNDRPYLWY